MAWCHWLLSKPLDYTHCTLSIDCVWVCECIIATQCCGSIATIPIILLCVCHNLLCWHQHWDCDNCWAQLVWQMCIWFTYKHWTRTTSMIIFKSSWLSALECVQNCGVGGYWEFSVMLRSSHPVTCMGPNSHTQCNHHPHQVLMQSNTQ